MVKSKLKIVPTILKLLLLFLGIGFAIFCSMILNLIISKFEFVALTGFLIFSLISFMGVYSGTVSLKTIIVDPEKRTIDLIYLWFWRTTLTENDIFGFKNFPFTNNLGSYSGILVQLKNGKQFQLSGFDIKNFKDIKSAISLFVETKNEMKINIWTSFNKAVLIYVGVFILLLGIGKFLGW